MILALFIMIASSFTSQGIICADVPRAWESPIVAENITKSILYSSIADNVVCDIPIKENDEEMIDLSKIDNSRLCPFVNIVLEMEGRNNIDDKDILHSYGFYKEFCSVYKGYSGYSLVRIGVYQRLIKMLNTLPRNIGIAYFEGLRPLWKQKEYFDEKFREMIKKIDDKNLAYKETTKHVSPFIDNIPTHATGAAIDIALFREENGNRYLLDMGKFDVIFGANNQQETFSKNTTMAQRKNRILLLEAATNAGFVNYGFEWWHYSYGDKAWAYVKGHRNAIYGLAADPGHSILSINKEEYMSMF